MKNLFLATLILLNCFISNSQNWFKDLYHVTTEQSIADNYKDIWLGTTFQGIIGAKYQRIEMRFLSVIKNSKTPNVYHVKGKSKVNNNICDFTGEFIIEKIITLKDTSDYGDAPHISKGMLWGRYVLKEDPGQNHVGVFEGELYVKFDQTKDGKTCGFNDLYYDHNNLLFNGTWQGYDSNQSKLCNWGWNIPPDPEKELFSEVENGYYYINFAYFDRGWQSYAIANNWIVVPKDYYSEKTRFSDDLMDYEQDLIQEAKDKEAVEWWKE